MIKPTPSCGQSQLNQMVRAEAILADATKDLEAKGFRRVEGTPDVWEYRGSLDDAQAILEHVLGPGKAKAWVRYPGPSYKLGTPLPAIIEDGWSRGFYPMQTLQEARALGYVVSLEWIQAHWARLTQEMYEVEANCQTRPEA